MLRLFAWLLLAVPPLGAHEFTITSVALVLVGDGTFRADVSLDADALALGLPLETDSETVASAMGKLTPGAFAAAVESAKQRLRQEISILFDGRASEFRVNFPHRGTLAATQADPATVLGTLARLSGVVPESAADVAFRADPQYKTVDLRILPASGAEPYQAFIDPGETSAPYPLSGKAPRQRGVFLRYLALGFEHILPKGLDHILFVLGLFLLSTQVKPLLYQVTAFTLAHTLTLALSMLGVIELPSRVVETLIAISIAYVAIENLVTAELKPWRVAIVFGFGLLHGLGFAGVLGQLGLPEGGFVPALVAFNVGVELGQLAVVALAFVVVGRFRHLPGYRRWVVVPVSIVIAVVGLWWAVERALL